MANILENSMDYLAQFDPEIASQMQSEYQRQQRNIELIASENIASPAVIAAMGSVLTNKYAEGYPGKRYYGGCEVVDVIEQIAIDRAKQLFGAEYANVQPHSGAQANLAAYMAVLQPGDTIVGMDLANGGHLTHGAKVNLSGKIYNSFSYGVNPETGLPDQQPGNVAALHHMNSRTLCRETISFAAAFSPSVMLFSLLILWIAAIFATPKSVVFLFLANLNKNHFT